MRRISVLGAIICALFASFGIKSGFALYSLYKGAEFSPTHLAAIAYFIGLALIGLLIVMGRFSLKYFIFGPDRP